jgi:hypothetical protein
MKGELRATSDMVLSFKIDFMLEVGSPPSG